MSLKREVAYKFRKFIKNVIDTMYNEYFYDGYCLIMSPSELNELIRTFKKEAYEYLINNFDEIVNEYQYQQEVMPIMRNILRGIKL